MDRIHPISDLQTGAKRIVEQVHATREPAIITQRGRPAAVLLDYEEYQGLIATVEEMREPDWRERLTEAEQDSRKGRGMDLDTYLSRREAPRGRKR
jgi:prevent-host-death family protein